MLSSLQTLPHTHLSAFLFQIYDFFVFNGYYIHSYTQNSHVHYVNKYSLRNQYNITCMSMLKELIILLNIQSVFSSLGKTISLLWSFLNYLYLFVHGWGLVTLPCLLLGMPFHSTLMIMNQTNKSISKPPVKLNAFFFKSCHC